MPTARGWAALGVAGALLVLWIGFGEVELMTTAIFLLAAVVVGLVLVGIRSSAVSLTRRLSPAQAHEGDTVVVEVEVAAARRLRNVIVEDASTARWIRRRHHRQPVPLRGALPLSRCLCGGPAEVSVMDPFSSAPNATTDRLLVYPGGTPQWPPRYGLDPAVHSARPTFAARGARTFTLRECQCDDLRRSTGPPRQADHWPAALVP
jgi:hypothetical protein